MFHGQSQECDKDGHVCFFFFLYLHNAVIKWSFFDSLFWVCLARALVLSLSLDYASQTCIVRVWNNVHIFYTYFVKAKSIVFIYTLYLTRDEINIHKPVKRFCFDKRPKYRLIDTRSVCVCMLWCFSI